MVTVSFLIPTLLEEIGYNRATANKIATALQTTAGGLTPEWRFWMYPHCIAFPQLVQLTFPVIFLSQVLS